MQRPTKNAAVFDCSSVQCNGSHSFVHPADKRGFPNRHTRSSAIGKTFHQGVVSAIALAVHARAIMVVRDQFLKSFAAELRKHIKDSHVL